MKVKVCRTSPFSGKQNCFVFEMTAEQREQYLMNEAREPGCKLIQEIFPELTADEREFLKTGLAPGEWEQLFPEDEEE